MDLHILSSAYVDNRSFVGFPDTGPVGYNNATGLSTVLIFIYNVTFLPLNQWLADGLLVSRFYFRPTHLRASRDSLLQLHRCYVIYSMNYWAMVFPCLIYVTSVGAPPIRLQCYGSTIC